MSQDELMTHLQDPDLQCYTIVRMALRDLEEGNMNAAMARLSVDADKLRCYDSVLYQFVVDWQTSPGN